MGVSVKAEWIENYNAEQNTKRESKRGKGVERFLLMAFVVSAIGAAVMTYLMA